MKISPFHLKLTKMLWYVDFYKIVILGSYIAQWISSCFLYKAPFFSKRSCFFLKKRIIHLGKKSYQMCKKFYFFVLFCLVSHFVRIIKLSSLYHWIIRKLEVRPWSLSYVKTVSFMCKDSWWEIPWNGIQAAFLWDSIFECSPCFYWCQMELCTYL